HAVTSGSPLRMEPPQSNRQPKHNPALVVMQEVNPVSGFLGFLRDYAVVGLAVGFVIGLQAQNLVKQLVTSFIDPAFNLLFGQALNQRAFVLEWHGRSSSFTWGAFAYGLLNFLFVLGAIYAIVKIFKLDKLDKPDKKDIDKMKEK
ncbi:MAG TPA: MscL family protein, partial [Candidatus Saccharimonadales bacterium]|nr:MscL family protein [Candidatus Saccharimonadales bacterium]